MDREREEGRQRRVSFLCLPHPPLPPKPKPRICPDSRGGNSGFPELPGLAPALWAPGRPRSRPSRAKASVPCLQGLGSPSTPESGHLGFCAVASSRVCRKGRVAGGGPFWGHRCSDPGRQTPGRGSAADASAVPGACWAPHRLPARRGPGRSAHQTPADPRLAGPRGEFRAGPPGSSEARGEGTAPGYALISKCGEIPVRFTSILSVGICSPEPPLPGARQGFGVWTMGKGRKGRDSKKDFLRVRRAKTERGQWWPEVRTMARRQDSDPKGSARQRAGACGDGKPSGDSFTLSMALPAPGRDPWSLLGLLLSQLFLAVPLPLTAGGGGQEPLPRITYRAGEGRRALSLFHQKGLQDFDTLLLSDDGGTLYVGAREAILALDIQDPGMPKLKNMIPWPASDRKKSECAFKKKSNETQCFNFIRVLVSFNATHLYTCGTFAFSPACTFIELRDSYLLPISEDKVVEGKGQSPFDPAHKHTAVLTDGMLYSGTMNNFLGSEPILIRTLGPQPVLKTDNFLRWLQPDASFVAAIPSTHFVYFFFEETASEFEFFEKLHTSRVARVCKNDVGGDKLLQKKWTTFLKAQLLCSQPGQLPFNVIRHAVLLPAAASAEPRVYATFSSQWQIGGTRSSAVCAFSLKDIKRVFEGKYKELNKETSRWTTYGVPEISPRPGSCSVGPSSDKALTFMKDHFLMDEQVVGTPLLVKSGVEYTRLAVETAQGADGHSHLVLYLGTATGALHKAVVSGDSGAHLVEEIQLFLDPEPVRNLLLAPEQGAVFAGFSGGIWRIPRANCSIYESCVDCVLARDPHCAWDPESRTCRLVPSPIPRSWRQDTEQGNPGWACATGPVGRSHQPQSRPQIIKEVQAAPNSILELPCPHLSALASYRWTRGAAKIPEASSAVYNGSLVLLLQGGVGGLYQCWATENGFSHPVVSYWVHSQDQPLALDPELAGIPRERVDAPLTRVGVGAAPAAQRSYWPHFLTVTVLLALVLSGALLLLLASPLGALRARGKVQGCGTLPPGEKAPLSREQHLQPPKECRTSASDVDADNNHLGTEVA